MAAENHESGRDSSLTPRVIGLIPERKRAEIEAAIDAPLTVKPFAPGRPAESEGCNVITVGKKRAGSTSFTTKRGVLADLRKESDDDHTTGDRNQ